MSKKPDGKKSDKTKATKAVDNSKKKEQKVAETKPRGPRPDFTPKEKRMAQEMHDAATSAEGTPEAKLALAEGKPGLYFICGEFFKIHNRQILDKETGAFKMTIRVIEEEKSHFYIPFDWVMVPGHKWEAKELTFSESRKKLANALRQKVLGYAGEEIAEARKLRAIKRHEEKIQEAFAAQVAEIRARASTDIGAMLWGKQEGTFMFSDGVVMQVTGTKVEVLIGNNEFGVGKHGRDSFFLHLAVLSNPMIHPNGKIKDEKTRNALYDWQTKVHNYLVAMKAATPQPITEKPKVVASENLDDLFRNDVIGNYAVEGLVVALEATLKGFRYRVLVGNNQVPASERNFLPVPLLHKVISPNTKITDEKIRNALYDWQTALQTVLNTAEKKLAPVIAETTAVAEIATAEPQPKPTPVHKPKCLEIPSLKVSKCVTADMLKNMSTQASGLFHLQEGRGRVYMFAQGGKLFLVQKSDTFPKDNTLARILDFHSSKDFEEGKLVYVDIQAIRQRQPLEEVANINEYKNARRAMQRYLHRMAISESEVVNKEKSTVGVTTSSSANFPANTALADLMAAVMPKISDDQMQHA